MLEAGRELDVLVAKHVIGLDCYGVELYRHDEFCELHNPPHYSTDIAATGEVVEKMIALAGQDEGGGGYVHEIKAPTAPLAICLAALKAVGYEPKESA